MRSLLIGIPAGNDFHRHGISANDLMWDCFKRHPMK
jgi:hypothetical protein